MVMRKATRLLPHWCQIAGYSYILCFLICCLYALLYAAGIIPDNSITRAVITAYDKALNHWGLIGALNFIMIFLAIFSKEKTEDEMTTSIRQRALTYLAYFIFLVHILVYLPESSTIGEAASVIRDFMMKDFGVMCICYAVLYKAMLFINKWSGCNEE